MGAVCGECEEGIILKRLQEEHVGDASDDASGGKPAFRGFLGFALGEPRQDGGGHDEGAGIEGQYAFVESPARGDVVIGLPNGLG